MNLTSPYCNYCQCQPCTCQSFQNPPTSSSSERMYTKFQLENAIRKERTECAEACRGLLLRATENNPNDPYVARTNNAIRECVSTILSRTPARRGFGCGD